MEFIRSIYPDIGFRVTDMCACTSGNKVRCSFSCYCPAVPVSCDGWASHLPVLAQVFVNWSMSGTFEGERSETSGISLMAFDDEGRIAETLVYRQALPAEVAMAQRSRGSAAVPQGILLEQQGEAYEKE